MQEIPETLPAGLKKLLFYFYCPLNIVTYLAGTAADN